MFYMSCVLSAEERTISSVGGVRAPWWKYLSSSTLIVFRSSSYGSKLLIMVVGFLKHCYCQDQEAPVKIPFPMIFVGLLQLWASRVFKIDYKLDFLRMPLCADYVAGAS